MWGMRWRLGSDCRGELEDAVLGRIAFSLRRGVVAPKSEQEEAALRHLEALGLADPVTDSVEGKP